MFCPRCGEEAEKGARYCASCGAELPRPGDPGEGGKRSVGDRLAALVGRSRKERMITLGTVLAVLVAVGAFILLDSGGDEDGAAGGGLAPADLAAVDEACVAAKRSVAQASRRAARARGDEALSDYSGAVLRSLVEFRSVVRGTAPSSAVQGLDEALRGAVVEAGALSRVAREDPEQVPERAAALDRSTAGVEAAINDLGLRRCARIELGPPVQG